MRIDVQRTASRSSPTYDGRLFGRLRSSPWHVRMVYQVAGACGIPVIGCGGVTTARDVIEMMMAGATAVRGRRREPGEPLCLARRSSRRCPPKWSGWASNSSPTSWVVLRGRTPIRRCGNVKRDDDVSGCEASLYDRVASRVHPLAGCRGAAAGTERSEGKGRFGGILNTVTSRRTGVRGCTEQERKT